MLVIAGVLPRTRGLWSTPECFGAPSYFAELAILTSYLAREHIDDGNEIRPLIIESTGFVRGLGLTTKLDLKDMVERSLDRFGTIHPVVIEKKLEVLFCDAESLHYHARCTSSYTFQSTTSQTVSSTPLVSFPSSAPASQSRQLTPAQHPPQALHRPSGSSSVHY